MDELPAGGLLAALIVLILLSAFFSSSETSMVALNRYRLRHLRQQGHRSASRVERMLERTDRLLSVILIGNNFVNNYAATLAALLGVIWFGNTGGALAPIVVTIIMLILAEVTPKTWAALRPESIAFPASLVLAPLQKLLAPLVWLVNGLSSALLRLLGLNPTASRHQDHLSPDELRTVVNEAGALIPNQHQRMLLAILDLESATVEDIMIPRNDMIGLDLDDDLTDLMNQLRAAQHTRMPVFRDDPNHIVGMLHLRKLSGLLEKQNINKAELMQSTVEPYFVPEGTHLHQQLINFQNERQRIAVVVDEYGEVLGLITLEDILEEIVGEFTTDLSTSSEDIHHQEDGSWLIDGSIHLRELNRRLQWSLPTDGPKTLNGLITEHLQDIPDNNTSLRLDDYLIEILQVKDNVVKKARVRLASDFGLASH